MLINRKNMPEDVKTAWKKISANQRKFCEKMVEFNENQTRACLAAYPNVKSERAAAAMASRVMINANIQKYFSWLQEQRQAFMDQEMEITVSKTLKKIAQIAYGESQELFTDDWHLKDKGELTDHQRSLVAGVDNFETILRTKDDEEGTLVHRTIRVRTKDQSKHLELLCKYLGILTENRRIIIDDPVTPEEDKAFNEEMRKAADIPIPKKRTKAK